MVRVFTQLTLKEGLKYLEISHFGHKFRNATNTLQGGLPSDQGWSNHKEPEKWSTESTNVPETETM